MRGDQIIAARALLKLSQVELAGAAGIAHKTLVLMERDPAASRESSRLKVSKYLTSAGIRFVDTATTTGVLLEREQDPEHG